MSACCCPTARNSCTYSKDWCRALERKEHEYPRELWEKLTAGGYHGIGIAEEYGGLGGDIVIQSVFMREFARTAAGLGWIWGITAFSGAGAIDLHGSPQQKQAGKRTQGLSLFFVPRETQGIRITPLDKLGMRALNSCAIHLNQICSATGATPGCCASDRSVMRWRVI
jgi:alkylation response protein AidB-like acyl-CoA dehydrogenase